jgi:predicted Rossmann fold nucleotide-binding protein DprA/Smf involved in DNA uptake
MMLPSPDDLIALRELPGIGERTVSRLMALLEHRGETVRSLLAADPPRLADTYHLPPPAVLRLTRERDQHFARCRWIGEELQRAGGRVLSLGSFEYPAKLKHSASTPAPILFALGRLAILRTPSVAVLSSRGIADHTLRALAMVVGAARDEGFSIAMGGMKSAHRLAAMTSRAVGASRIIVLDRGLFSAFGYDYHRDPFGCGDHHPVLDCRSTLVLSPFRPEDHAAPDSGRRRDQLIAGLGDLVFASSARPGGEVERTCLAAIGEGKQVLVWGDHNRTLLDAGARAVDATGIAGGFRQFVDGRAGSIDLGIRPATRRARDRTSRRPRSPGG